MTEDELSALAELLEFAKLSELAAKAAGIKLGLWSDDAQAFHVASDPPYWWNPIFNDGDALRLAVNLGIDLEWRRDGRVAAYRHATSHGHCFTAFESSREDRNANTRRAIVRAAAEIGRAMP